VTEITFDPSFKKSFHKRIANNLKLSEKFDERTRLFSKENRNPIIRDHQLTGNMRHYRSFSITGDIRVIYRVIDDNTVAFVDIGTHNQVYGG
jgi:addiction module RelE/StbE family toxin